MLTPKRSVAALCLALMLAPAGVAAAQCENPTVDYNVLVSALERVPGDAFAEVTVTPTEAGDVVSQSVPLNERTVVTAASGAASISIEREGSETRTFERDTCSNTALSVILMPDATVTLSGRVFLNEAAEADESAGAAVYLDGEDERAGVMLTSEVDSEGSYTISDVPAGIYRLRVTYEDASSTQGFARSGVDLLGDAQVAIRLRSSADLPDVDEGCATVPSHAGLSTLATVMFVGLLILRRRDD